MRLDTAALFTILILITAVTSNTAVNDTNKSVERNRHRIHVNWTRELDTKLMDIWARTNPLKRGHGSRMVESWLNEVKAYKNVHGKLLKDRAREILRGKIRVPGLPPIDPNLRRMRAKWTPEMELELYRIFKSIKPSSNRPKQMYDEWLKTHEPEDSVTPTVLYRHALQLQNSGFKNENSNVHLATQRHHWSAEENLQLMKIWNEVYREGGRGTGMKIYKKWKELNPDNGDITPNKLATQAYYLMQKGFTIPPEHNAGGDPIKIDNSLKRERDEIRKTKKQRISSLIRSKIMKLAPVEKDLPPQDKDNRNTQWNRNEDNSHTLQLHSPQNYQSRNNTQIPRSNVTLNHHLNDDSKSSSSKPPPRLDSQPSIIDLNMPTERHPDW